MITEGMVYCTRCGINEVSAPRSIEEDPLCAGCIQELMHEAADNVMARRLENPHSIAHPRNAAEFEQTIGRIAKTSRPATDEVYDQEQDVREFNNDEGGCPGHDDSCGNMLPEGSDLCAECTAKRGGDDDGTCPDCGELLDQDDTGLTQCPNKCEMV